MVTAKKVVHKFCITLLNTTNKVTNTNGSIVQIEPVLHGGESRIALRFPYDAQLIQQVKALPGARWSATKRYWHVPDTVESKIALRKANVAIEADNSPAAQSSSAKAPLVDTPTMSPTGTTADVPAQGEISGISCLQETSVLPPSDTRAAADILGSTGQDPVEITLQGRSLVIRMPYQASDVALVPRERSSCTPKSCPFAVGRRCSSVA